MDADDLAQPGPGDPADPASRFGHVLLERVGAGAGGSVHRAHPRVRPGRVVAVRVLPGDADAPGVATVVARAARIDHPAVARPETLFTDDDGAGLVVPWSAGGPALVGTWESRRVRAAGARLAAGLEALHAAGISHGWIRPGSILLDPQGDPVLGDVGVAAALRRHVDPGADVAALAATLRDLLADPDEDAVLAVALEAVARSPAPTPTDLAHACRPHDAAPVAPPDTPAPTWTGMDHTMPRIGMPAVTPTRPRLRRLIRQVAVGVAAGVVVGVAVAGVVTVTGLGNSSSASAASPVDRSPAGVAAAWPGVWCQGTSLPTPDTVALAADVDGRGCTLPVAVTVEVVDGDDAVVLEVPRQAGDLAGRYVVADDADTVVVGDWDGDGVDTPAVVQPGGQVFTYTAWDSGRAAPAGTAPGPAVVVITADGRDRVVAAG